MAESMLETGKKGNLKVMVYYIWKTVTGTKDFGKTVLRKNKEHIIGLTAQSTKEDTKVINEMVWVP